MTRTLLIYGLLFLISSFGAIAQNNTRSLKVWKDSTLVRSVKNYDKFSFRDSSGKQHSGKIALLNDSQFYFVNYFYERIGRTFHTNEVYALYFPGKRWRKISTVEVILISLFLPGGVYYLIIREVVRQFSKKEDRKLKGWINSSGYRITIETYTSGS